MDLIPWSRKSPTRSGTALEHPRARFRDEIDDVFGRFLRDPWGTSLSDVFPRTGNVIPQLELAESDQDITVRVELPGVRPEDVDIEVTGNTLRLSGEKRDEKREQRGGQQYTERQYGRFVRTVPLSTAVDTDKVDAQYQDGVLTVTLPKRPEAQPKRIRVRNA